MSHKPNNRTRYPADITQITSGNEKLENWEQETGSWKVDDAGALRFTGKQIGKLESWKVGDTGL